MINEYNRNSSSSAQFLPLTDKQVLHKVNDTANRSFKTASESFRTNSTNNQSFKTAKCDSFRTNITNDTTNQSFKTASESFRTNNDD